MTTRPVLRWPDQALQVICQPVLDPSDVSDLIRDMFDTMYAAPGRGLAAPQIGINARLFVMDAGWKSGSATPLACINPTLDLLGPCDVIDTEACLSMPNIAVRVTRADRIRLSFLDETGAAQTLELDGAAARIAQHEADHLDGVMHIHRLSAEARASALTEWNALP
ncbi:peptide deformylase [Sagittula sp. SSi028]|uniref:peptide deformylase n=1 Tax=Sagittula sp. SSi028 TaxID=3400636 RepID=UPI003AF8585A